MTKQDYGRSDERERERELKRSDEVSKPGSFIPGDEQSQRKTALTSHHIFGQSGSREKNIV